LRSSLLGAPLGPKGVGSLSKAKGAPDPTTAEARAAAAAVLRLFPAQKENELTPSHLVLQGLAFARNFSPLRAKQQRFLLLLQLRLPAGRRPV
jgi:hypothetical protein